jgi:hypothetical protein
MLPFVNLTWPPTLNGAVNKRDLSTRETGEFADEKVGFGLNPGVAFGTPHDISSNQRERETRKKLAECCGYGRGRRWALLSTKYPFRVRMERYWLPDMDSNHDKHKRFGMCNLQILKRPRHEWTRNTAIGTASVQVRRRVRRARQHLLLTAEDDECQ